MSRAVPLLLGELLEAPDLVARYTDGLTVNDFAATSEKQDAVVRRLAAIGEAVTGVPGPYIRGIMAAEGIVDGGAL